LLHADALCKAALTNFNHVQSYDSNKYEGAEAHVGSVSELFIQLRGLPEKGRHLSEAPEDLEDALWRIPTADEQADGDIDKMFERPRTTYAHHMTQSAL
jgi:hypothetical protein